MAELFYLYSHSWCSVTPCVLDDANASFITHLSKDAISQYKLKTPTSPTTMTTTLAHPGQVWIPLCSPDWPLTLNTPASNSWVIKLQYVPPCPTCLFCYRISEFKFTPPLAAKLTLGNSEMRKLVAEVYCERGSKWARSVFLACPPMALSTMAL